MEKVLITGITGQDGIFLTKEILLNNPNSKIYGISRQKNNLKFLKNLESIGIKNYENITVLNDISNKDETLKILKSLNIAKIYNLSGPSSVYESINQLKKLLRKLLQSSKILLVL